MLIVHLSRFFSTLGLLLHGPPGVGKTYSVREALQLVTSLLSSSQQLHSHPRLNGISSDLLSGHASVPCLRLIMADAPAVLSPIPGVSEARLSEIFKSSRLGKPLRFHAQSQMQQQQQQQQQQREGDSEATSGRSSTANAQSLHYPVALEDACPHVSFDHVYPLSPLLSSLSSSSSSPASTSLSSSSFAGVPVACVLFFDEVDSLCPKRKPASEGGSATMDRLVALMLTLVDGFANKTASSQAQHNNHNSSNPSTTTNGTSPAERSVPLCIVGATNRPHSLDPALRRPGRLDRELALAPPDAKQRALLLRKYTSSFALDASVNLDKLADACVGFVGADIEALCREAAMACLRETLELEQQREQQQQQQQHGQGQGQGQGQGLCINDSSAVRLPPVSWRHIHAGLMQVTASSLRDAGPFNSFRLKLSELSRAVNQSTSTSSSSSSLSSTQYSDKEGKERDTKVQESGRISSTSNPLDEEVGGLEDVKKRLREAVEWPILYADTYRRLGLRAPRGVLMHGPPGGGKTSIARALARGINASFLSLSSAEVYNSYLGEAERTIRTVFTKARANRPCVIFLDELDSLVTKRDMGEGGSGSAADSMSSRILSTLLNEMDGIVQSNGLLVVAATNRVDRIDAALLRPGRFDHVIYVPAPDAAAAERILVAHTRHMAVAADVDLASVAARAVQVMGETVSGAKLAHLCHEAAMCALRRYRSSAQQQQQQRQQQQQQQQGKKASSAVFVTSSDFAACLDALEVR